MCLQTIPVEKTEEGTFRKVKTVKPQEVQPLGTYSTPHTSASPVAQPSYSQLCGTAL